MHPGSGAPVLRVGAVNCHKHRRLWLAWGEPMGEGRARRKATQRLAAAVLILAALTVAWCAQNMAYAPIQSDHPEDKRGDTGGC